MVVRAWLKKPPAEKNKRVFGASSKDVSPYRSFTAAEWGRLRKDAELMLTETELEKLRGRGETVSLDEVEEIYLPLSRLLNLYVEASQDLYGATNAFLGREIKVPFHYWCCWFRGRGQKHHVADFARYAGSLAVAPQG